MTEKDATFNLWEAVKQASHTSLAPAKWSSTAWLVPSAVSPSGFSPPFCQAWSRRSLMMAAVGLGAWSRGPPLCSHVPAEDWWQMGEQEHRVLELIPLFPLSYYHLFYFFCSVFCYLSYSNGCLFIFSSFIFVVLVSWFASFLAFSGRIVQFFVNLLGFDSDYFHNLIFRGIFGFLFVFFSSLFTLSVCSSSLQKH